MIPPRDDQARATADRDYRDLEAELGEWLEWAHEAKYSGLSIVHEAADAIADLRAQRDKWLDLFNRSEQFQSGPTQRAETAERERDDAKEQLSDLESVHRETLRYWRAETAAARAERDAQAAATWREAITVVKAMAEPEEKEEEDSDEFSAGWDTCAEHLISKFERLAAAQPPVEEE